MEAPLVLMNIPADAESISVVRHAMAGVATIDDWDPVFLTDVNVAVTEACENAVLHGFPHGNPGTVSIGVYVDDDDIVVRVADDGDGFPSVDARDDQATEGLGVMLMLTLSDDLAISSPPGGPTELTMRFHAARIDDAP